jgi:putative DNA primase/helicase
MTVTQPDLFEQVKQHALVAYLSHLQRWLPGGKVVGGKEYVVLNPTRADKTLGSFSINIHTGKWLDGATGDEGGDPIGLYAYLKCGGTSRQHRVEACKLMAEEFGLSDDRSAPVRAKPELRVVKPEPKEDEWTPIVPPPADASAPNLNYDHVFTYRDRDGRLLRYVVRNDAKGDEGKYIRPLTYGVLKGKKAWHKKGPDDPKSLYGLERLKNGFPVLLQEGEKKTDAVAPLLPGYACLSLTGGTGQAGHSDLAPLAGLSVLCAPDNDGGGLATMGQIGAKLSDMGCAVLILNVSSHGFPNKWDLGDAVEKEGWDAEKLEAFLTDNAKPFAPDPPKKERKAKAEDLDGFARNEDGIALAFADKHRDQLRFCHTTGAWFIWTGSRWQKEETKLAFHWARDLCRELNADGENALAKAATSAAVERFAQSDRAFAVTGAIWDKDSFLLGTPGGTVDLKTGLLSQARQEDFMTKQTAVTPADPLHGEGCPLWLAFLEQATKGDRELIRFMQQIAGYALTGDTREHALFFIHGPGGNGKGVFLNTITKIIGDYATTAAMDTFTASQSDKHPTDLAKLKGARLVTASETEEGRAWAESRIKQMTGGDRISARFMRQDFFEFDPTFKLVIVGNHKPILHNVDEAARRRFNIIPFIHKPAVPDKQLEKKLEAERAAILRWAIDGCLDWQRNGLVRSASVAKATEAYFEDQDKLGNWLEECCRAERDNRHLFEPAKNLYKSWKEFCLRNGEEPGTSTSFGETLSKSGFGKERKKLLGTTTVIRTGISIIVRSRSEGEQE